MITSSASSDPGGRGRGAPDHRDGRPGVWDRSLSTRGPYYHHLIVIIIIIIIILFLQVRGIIATPFPSGSLLLLVNLLRLVEEKRPFPQGLSIGHLVIKWHISFTGWVSGPHGHSTRYRIGLHIWERTGTPSVLVIVFNIWCYRRRHSYIGATD